MSQTPEDRERDDGPAFDPEAVYDAEEYSAEELVPLPAICPSRKCRAEYVGAEAVLAPSLDNARCFYCGSALRPHGGYPDVVGAKERRARLRAAAEALAAEEANAPVPAAAARDTHADATDAEPCAWCGGKDARGTCPHAVGCPACRAKPGARCKRPSGHPAPMHSERYRAAEKADAGACPGFEPADTPGGAGCRNCSGLPEDHAAPGDDGGGYDPGHPWYYFLGGTPVGPDAIPTLLLGEDRVGMPKRKKGVTRREQMTRRLAGAETALAADVVRYEELRDKGDDALTPYEVRVGDVVDGTCRAIHSALALKYNHILLGKGVVRRLLVMLGGQPVVRDAPAPPPAVVDSGPAVQRTLFGGES
jgi:hypothetical protein